MVGPNPAQRIRHLEKESVVIFSAGRAIRLFNRSAAARVPGNGAEILLKPPRRGIYDSDTKRPRRQEFQQMTNIELLAVVSRVRVAQRGRWHGK